MTKFLQFLSRGCGKDTLVVAVGGGSVGMPQASRRRCSVAA
ncbi:MAG: hypothetical protein ACLU1U_05155 [Lachnospiraceae bacterium]